jgi:hypothetical protein
MAQSHSVPNRDQAIDIMVDLTRLSTLHRAIIAGGDSMELYLALRRRGFVHVATTATCRVPRGQHAVGLITGQDSLGAIEAALAEISRFLCIRASIAILIESRESGFCLKIRAKLARLTNALAKESPAALKFALCLLGLMHPNTRLPIVELAESAKAEVASAIAEIGDEDLAGPSHSWSVLT